MGHIRHDAIIVTGWDSERVKRGRGMAELLGLPCSAVVKSHVNGYESFLIAPDGSKEGWLDSDRGDELRAKWCAWIKTQPEIYLDWVHVRFGGDEKEVEILGHVTRADE